MKVSVEERDRLEAGLSQLRGEVALAQEIWRECKSYGLGAAYPEGPLQRAVEEGRITARLIALIVEAGSIVSGVNASEAGRRGGQARQAGSLEERALVYDCWLAWKNQPARYRSQAAFIRDMLEKLTQVKNAETIARWCREWKKTPTETLQ